MCSITWQSFINPHNLAKMNYKRKQSIIKNNTPKFVKNHAAVRSDGYFQDLSIEVSSEA